MPRIIEIPTSLTNTATVQLHKERLVVDERAILPYSEVGQGRRFACAIEGTTLTVTRTDNTTGWSFQTFLRVYDPDNEALPDFTSKSYKYHGLPNERAPIDAEEVTVDENATVIGPKAFYGCDKMKKCIMGDQVTTIENYAFYRCVSMKSIRLSRTLQSIGHRAFWCCTSIECLFIPPDVRIIQDWAFLGCTEMKILVLPTNIDLDQIGHKIVDGCPRLLNASTRMWYEENELEMTSNNGQINRWLKHRYDNAPLLRLCADPRVTVEMIENFEQRNGIEAFHQTDDDHGLLLPLHILTRYNAYVGNDVIITCRNFHPFALTISDAEGNSPLNNLWTSKRENHDNLDVIKQFLIDETAARKIGE